jgi:membrane-bound lytic murein transglycosylase F
MHIAIATHRFLTLLLFLALGGACQAPTGTPDVKPVGPTLSAPDLDEIRQQGKLRILTRNAPTTYYEDRDGELKGIEYELTRAFANELGVAVEYEFHEGVPRVLEALARREAHIAAAGITLTPKRAAGFAFATPYQTVQQEVVCSPNVRIERVRTPADLVRVTLAVPAGTSYDQRLQLLQDAYPALTWEASEERYTEQLLQEVAEGTIDCTVADSNLVAVHQRYYLGIRKAFALGEPETLAWAMNPEQPKLLAAANAYFAKVSANGELEALLHKYYGHTEEFDPHDIQVFLKRIETRLPKYRPLFEEAAAESRLPWRLLAAVAYQESQWNPAARSPTGVRGMMMLTQATAASLGVKERLDAKQSIRGGARYLRSLIDRIPGHIDEETRIWMALASYNVGYYHLRDARSLSVLLDKNPSSWNDVEDVLPLLSQQKYYRRLTHGYARGYEPVLYVRRIRNYRDLLIKHVPDEIQPIRAVAD